VSSRPTVEPSESGALSGRRTRFGDLLLEGITALAAAVVVVLVALIVWKVVDGALPAIRQFGLGFLTSRAWDVNKNLFGAATFIFGTVVSSLGALLIAAPVSIAIALFLTELAPRWLRSPVGSIVEMLASVPSVVLGLWGILVLGPFLKDQVEPWLGRTLGFVPLFHGSPQLVGMLPAILILTIMIVPIVSSITRELFLGVPRDLKEAALALGLTRWEMVRGVVFPYARAGMAAALILGLGRAIGEAIAVTQVIGGNVSIHWSLFEAGDTLASRIASQYQGATTKLQIASIVELAVILLAFSLVANLAAQWIVRRVARRALPGVRAGAAG
jgi:phosphate transport system permease protein